MKRRFAALCVLLVLISCAFAEGSWKCPDCGKMVPELLGDVCPYCGGARHTHVWLPATCTEPETCRDCGETRGDPAGHAWQEATCTVPKTCAVCGATEGNVLPHSWDEGTVTLQADCHTEGILLKACTVCGETKEEALPRDPKNHTGGTETRDGKEATCTEDGYTGDIYCLGCGKKLEAGKAIQAKGHVWEKTAEGTVTLCRVCGTVEEGQHVFFGSYPQTAEGNDHTSIEWLVLDYEKESNSVLLLSKYGLDAQPYSIESGNATWQTCYLRAWLNGEFYHRAFRQTEQAAIRMTPVKNGKEQGNTGWDAIGGNDTNDKVFLLSCAEASQAFGVTQEDRKNRKSRMAPTAYAIQQGTYISSTSTTEEGERAVWWWLRSPGSRQNNAAAVSPEGSLNSLAVHLDYGIVRPALWVDLSAVSGSPKDTAAETGNTSNTNSTEKVEASGKTGQEGQIEAGTCVPFGHYPQTEEGTDDTPIEWLVLEVDKENDRALLLSRYGLDAKPYNDEDKNITWQTCSLRTWLNGAFYHKAFSPKEQQAIRMTVVKNGKDQGYSEWDTNGGQDTNDKVFLLSYAEANRYLGVSPDESSEISYANGSGMMAPTAYAISQGAFISPAFSIEDGKAAGSWLLRSPGPRQNRSANVTALGRLTWAFPLDADNCVRPALWVDLGLLNED